MSSMWFSSAFPFGASYPPLTPLLISPFTQQLFPNNNLLLPQFKNFVNKALLPIASTSALKNSENVEEVIPDVKNKKETSNTISKSQMFLVESLLTSVAASSEAEKSKSPSVSSTPTSPFPVSESLVLIQFLTFFSLF